MPTPATTSRSEGATLSRLAATATAASTASMNSSVCMIAVMALRPSSEAVCALDEIRDHVHGQRQYRQVEEERQHAVQRHHATDDLAGDGDVGNLRGQADDQREIEKIQIVGLVVLGKIKPTDLSVAALAVIFVRIVD